MKNFIGRSLWSRVLLVLGSIGMLVGALDPMEGAVIILAGSLLVALGTFLGQCEGHWIAYRVLVFSLVTIGVGAMWGLSMAGGIGGKSGHSMWWGVLILPYLIGWSMGIWGPGSPRWLLLLGIGVGLWHLFIATMVLVPKHSRNPDGAISDLPGITIAALGMLTIGGCLRRLKKRIPKQPPWNELENFPPGSYFGGR